MIVNAFDVIDQAIPLVVQSQDLSHDLPHMTISVIDLYMQGIRSAGSGSVVGAEGSGSVVGCCASFGRVDIVTADDGTTQTGEKARTRTPQHYTYTLTQMHAHIFLYSIHAKKELPALS